MFTKETTQINKLTEIFKGAALDFPLVVDQVAIVVQKEMLETAKNLLGAMGHSEWTSDANKAVGTVFGVPSRVEGELHFSYSTINIKPDRPERGVEFEILVYNTPDLTPQDGGDPFDDWHSSRNRRLGTSHGTELSHFGFHLPSEKALEQVRKVMLDAGFDIAQEVRTVSHTNPFLKETGRKYHYLIFNSRDTLGFDAKFIARVQ
jgi:hypothetical protein